MRSNFTQTTGKVRSAWWKNLLPLLLGTFLFAGSAHAQLSGTYTICSSGCDYSKISDAANDLNSKGVSGPVTFNISAGTYSDYFTVNNFSGASATNTVTFKGAGKNSTRVSTSSSSQVAYLNGCKYVTLDGMELSCTSSSSPKAVYAYGANYCTVKNCRLLAPFYGTSYIFGYPVYIYYSYGLNFTNNDIMNGYYCVYVYNYGSSTYGNLTFKNNHITGFYYYGFYNYAYSATGNTYDGNYVDSSGSGSGYGIMSYYENGVTIKNNRLMMSGKAYSGMYLYYPNYTSTANQSLIYNNFAGGSYYPLYTYCYSSNVKFTHNTFHSATGLSYNSYVYIYASGVEVSNNSFTATSGSSLVSFSGSSAPSPFEGNNYYNGTGFNVTYNGTSYSDAGSFRSALGLKYVLAMPMPFKSATDWHLDQSQPAPYGPYSGISVDIDGDSRCTLFPTGGADESTFGKGKPTANFFGPNPVIDGTPVTFYNSAKQGEPKIFTWYIDGVKVSDSIHLYTTALKGKSSAVVKLVVQGCGGSDSIQKTISIVLPSKTPTTDFVADKNVIRQGDKVFLTDISVDGPSSWQWSISPDSTLNGGYKVASYKILYGSLTTPNLQIKFDYPGKYKVCLTTSNAKGKGTTECKVDYIEVVPYIQIGSVAETNNAQGYLYGKLSSGTTLINPCASKVYMVVTMFDMYCGYDYLTLYDTTAQVNSKICKATKGSKISCNFTSNTGYYGKAGFTGNNSYLCSYFCQPSKNDTFVAESGKMLCVEDVHVTNGQGFEAYWWSTPKTNISKPKAGFTMSGKGANHDSVCTNGTISYTNTTTGSDVQYFWDFDGDLSSFESSSSKGSVWYYPFPGKFTTTLIAINCGGIDTFRRTVTVYDPSAPKAAFTADNTNPTNTDVVFFTNSTSECVDNFTWKFSWKWGKGSYTYMNGTGDVSPNPQVVFNDTGCWNVTLVTQNVAGSDSMVKSCYIYVKNAYCIPSVATVVPDLGISHVVFNTIDNTTPQGVKDYTSYVATASTTVEIGVTYKLTIERTTNKNKMTRTVWIDWNGDGQFNGTGEQVDQELNASTLSWSTNITIPSYAKSGATVMRIGTSQGSQPDLACGQNQFGEYEDYRLYVRPDMTAPVISLRSSKDTSQFVTTDTLRIEQGKADNDAMFQYLINYGFRAIDNLDGDITGQVSVTSAPKFEPFITGTYVFTYNVKDAAGNPAVPRKRVVIITPDVTAPELIVEKPDTTYVGVHNQNYHVPQVLSAMDLVDGDVSDSIHIFNATDVDVVGTYKITYTVSDFSGNVATVYRYVVVIDTVKPLMTLIGSNPAYAEVFSNYVDSGVDVKDNYYSEADLRKALVMQSNVNTKKIGTYQVVYVLTDPSGNGPVSVTRTVIVQKTTKPRVVMNGADSVILEVCDKNLGCTPYNDPGVTYSDLYYSNSGLTPVTGGSFYATFPDGRPKTLGTYLITYTVSDSLGNSTTVSRTIIVKDLTAPVITLKGDVTAQVCRWEDYKDSGYALSDNYYASAKIKVDTLGTFKTKGGTLLTGLYSLYYKATDGSGNVSLSDTRFVYVQACTTGIRESQSGDNSVSVYPNPGAGLFTVTLSKVEGLNGIQKGRITVANLLGQVVGDAVNVVPGFNSYNIDLRGQAAGVYMLSVTTGDKTVTKRIVLEK